VIQELSEGNRIELRDFGVFETRTRPRHTARNPRTKKPVDVPPRASIKFKAGRVMKERIQELVSGGGALRRPAASTQSPVEAPGRMAARGPENEGDGD
jgi:hypothetical protein